MSDIAKPVHRLFGLVLFAGAPAVLATLAVLNLVDAGENRARSAQDGALLARLAGRIAQGTAGTEGADISQIYVPGTTPSLASANLRQRVVDLVASANGRLIETRAADSLAPNGAADGTEVRLNATFDSDNEGLATILQDLETGLPLLEIEKLSLRRAAAEGADDAGNPQLRVEMMIRGFVASGTSGAAP